MVRPRQPPEIEKHTVGAAGLGQFAQPGVVGLDGVADARQPCRRQPFVGGRHGPGLDVQCQHPARRPRQTAEKFRVMAVAAGGVDVKAARGQVGGEEFMAEPHRRQIGHPPPDQPGTVGAEIELCRQRPGGVVGGQGRGEPGLRLGVQAAVSPQQFLE